MSDESEREKPDGAEPAAEQEPGVAEQAPPVRLDLSLCKSCGICIALCPEDVFDGTDLGEPMLARPEACTACLLCELHCPDFAIEVRRRDKKGAAAEANEKHSDRVFAALASSPKADAAEVTGDEEPCAPRHEEH